jgi:antitoxin (DNA-binding transcriptional repressor) of toxin-antitoxin stability system
MTTTINIETTQYQLSELLALVRAGGEVIVQEGNAPVALLSPVAAKREKKPFIFGLSAGLGTVPDDFNDELPEEYRGQGNLKPLVLGMFAGAGTVPDDFNDDLPLSFWLDEEE